MSTPLQKCAEKKCADMRAGTAIPLPLTIAIFAVAFCLPACPWLSGGVTIPWDAKSQFFPPVHVLAASLARGGWPCLSPILFAGWPLITYPQSLLFSPIHFLLATSSPAVDI